MGRGSSGIGGGGKSGKLAKALAAVEDRIRGNPTESAVALDENGNIIFDTSDGQRDSVNLTADQQMLAYGKTITHNHPRGYMFSPEDLNVAETLSLKQLRATTPDGGAFVLEKGEGATDIRGLRLAYKQERNATAQEVALKVWNLNPNLSEKEFQHQANLDHTRMMNVWLKNEAPKYGYTFREEKK